VKKLKVMMVTEGGGQLPDEKEFHEYENTPEWSTEISVYRALKAIGHETRFMGFNDEIYTLFEGIKKDEPDIVFNLAESSLGEYEYDKNIPAVLELLALPYTGCGPSGLMLCNNKAITKKILIYHEILVPRFCVYRVGETVKFPEVFNAPHFVKPLKEEASAGISQRSLAENEEKCRERIKFVQEELQKDALVEEYIDGRELYVSVMGKGKNIKVLPVWELKFTNDSFHEPKIATYHAKWNENYRKKWGIKNEHADPLPDGIEEKIIETCKKAYRVLNLDAYARFDLRLTPAGDVYIIEVNANPELAKGEDFAASAEKQGISYEELIEKILHLGINRSAG